MVDKELIEIWRNMLKPAISSQLLKTNYEGMGEQDKEEFERDLDEILDLALIGLKCKAQLSQEDTEERTGTRACDLISRQAVIDALHTRFSGGFDEDKWWNSTHVLAAIKGLPSVQPEYEPVTAEDFAKTMSETSVYSYMLWHSEALVLMERQGFVVCKKTV